MGRLSGKVAFVTGAARGQGRAQAVRLAAEGADVIAIDVLDRPSSYVTYASATQADLDETVKLVEAAGGGILARQADVRRLDQLESVVQEGIDRFGRLDIVVANAGILNFGPAWELTEEQWQDMIDVNLTGVWKTTKVAIPTLIEQGQGGSIIIISSVAGLRGLPHLAHYTSAKHGIVGLCRSLASELAEYDIRVNTIHPNGVRTGMVDSSLSSVFQEKPHLAPSFMPALPHAMIEPEDTANLVAFLASDEGRYITGAQVPIDLGTLTR